MELSCTFYNEFCGYPGANPGATVYTCKIEYAMITKPGTFIKSINGSHQTGKTNNDVEEIWFTRSTVEHFPRGLGKIFPNLKRLDIHNCGLKEISRRDFVGLEGLIVLHLYYNEIESLPDDLFIGMKNLQFIMFNDNKISCASSKLLKPIEKELKLAFFSGNTKIDPSKDDLLYTLKLNELNQKMTPAALNDLKQHLDRCDSPKVEDSRDFLYSFGDELELMWTSGKYSDFSILVDKKEFKVHKCVLGTQSSFFETMFDQKMEENLTGKMKIDVFGAEPVEEFLKFFYTYEAPSAFNALEVFKLAEMYEVPELADLSEEIIIQNIDESNVVEVVQLANVHERDDMKSSAVEFVKSLHPGKNLKDSLFNDCEALKKIIEIKKAYDLALGPHVN